MPNKKNSLRELIYPTGCDNWPRKIKYVMRMLEKMRILHNHVGDLYMKRVTPLQFKKLYPNLWRKLYGWMGQPTRIDKERWNRFLGRWDIIYNRLLSAKNKLQVQLRKATQQQKDTLVTSGLISEVEEDLGEKLYSLNRGHLYHAASEHEKNIKDFVDGEE